MPCRAAIELKLCTTLAICEGTPASNKDNIRRSGGHDPEACVRSVSLSGWLTLRICAYHLCIENVALVFHRREKHRKRVVRIQFEDLVLDRL